jgi:hypothetical protein
MFKFMAYNFKSIADVEIVAEPAESANVLIEENGVIKKAPKTAVGGGNTEWDAIFEVIEGSSGFFESIELVTGSFMDLKEKIFAGISPKILIKYSVDSYAAGLITNSSISYWTDEDLLCFWFLCCDGNMRDLKLYADGHVDD